MCFGDEGEKNVPKNIYEFCSGHFNIFQPKTLTP